MISKISGMHRSIEQYRNGVPERIMEGSPAQVLYALKDGREDLLIVWGAMNELLEAAREAIPFLEAIARSRHAEWRPEMADSDSLLGRTYAAIAKAEGRA